MYCFSEMKTDNITVPFSSVHFSYSQYANGCDFIYIQVHWMWEFLWKAFFTFHLKQCTLKMVVC